MNKNRIPYDLTDNNSDNNNNCYYYHINNNITSNQNGLIWYVEHNFNRPVSKAETACTQIWMTWISMTSILIIPITEIVITVFMIVFMRFLKKSNWSHLETTQSTWRPYSADLFGLQNLFLPIPSLSLYFSFVLCLFPLFPVQVKWNQYCNYVSVWSEVQPSLAAGIFHEANRVQHV